MLSCLRGEQFQLFQSDCKTYHPIRELDEWVKKGALNEVLGYEGRGKTGFNSHHYQSNLFNKMVLVQIIEGLTK